MNQNHFPTKLHSNGLKLFINALKISLDTTFTKVESSIRMRGTLHYGHGVERTLEKLPSGEQDRSPLQYTNCRV